MGSHDQLDVGRTSYNINQHSGNGTDEQVDPNYRVLAYKEKVPTPEAGYQNKLRVLYSVNDPNTVSTSIPTRPLPSSPEKTLNAPDLLNNYYLNLLDWGANNILAIALNNTVFLWNPSSGGIESFLPCDNDDYVCSVAWLNDGGNFLAVGTTRNEVQLWDTSKLEKMRTFGGHAGRVSSLAWNHVSTSIPTRPLPSSPEKTLNAPDLLNNYYLNLLDWGANNILAIALNNTVFLWNPSSGGIESFLPCDNDDYVCSVAWLNDGGNFLAVGTTRNEVQLWDTSKLEKMRTFGGHAGRVSSLAWNHHILTSGGKDSRVINHDVRVAKHITNILYGHDQEVCGLAWSLDGKFLASGGNDNKLCIFDDFSSREGQAKYVLTDHMAAVKALAWCPYQNNVLATGGGSADRCIKLWNASTGTLLNSVDTGSQVCALKWNPHEKELLSAHGYAKNQLCLWKYPNMTLMKEFFAHEARVLHLAVSPDGTFACSAGADEKMSFWRIFGTSCANKKKSDVVLNASSVSSFGRIR